MSYGDGINIGALPFLLMVGLIAALLMFAPRTARSWYVWSKESEGIRVDPKSEALEDATLRAQGITLGLIVILAGYAWWHG